MTIRYYQPQPTLQPQLIRQLHVYHQMMNQSQTKPRLIHQAQPQLIHQHRGPRAAITTAAANLTRVRPRTTVHRTAPSTAGMVCVTAVRHTRPASKIANRHAKVICLLRNARQLEARRVSDPLTAFAPRKLTADNFYSKNRSNERFFVTMRKNPSNFFQIKNNHGIGGAGNIRIEPIICLLSVSCLS
jgi:hypothetical protein